MLGLAMTRRCTYQAIGALGVIELTAPGRVAKVATGIRGALQAAWHCPGPCATFKKGAMTVPHYHLRRMHRILVERGVLVDACVTRGYLSVLQRAASR